MKLIEVLVETSQPVEGPHGAESRCSAIFRTETTPISCMGISCNNCPLANAAHLVGELYVKAD